MTSTKRGNTLKGALLRPSVSSVLQSRRSRFQRRLLTLNVGKYGFDEGVAGHITLRDPVDPSTFWVNPFGVAFSLIKRSDLIQIDEEGNIIDGGEVRLLNSAAFMIHSAVHRARPDVMCAAHSHSIYGRTFCALGRTLDTITQDSCSFHNVCQCFHLSWANVG